VVDGCCAQGFLPSTGTNQDQTEEGPVNPQYAQLPLIQQLPDAWNYPSNCYPERKKEGKKSGFFNETHSMKHTLDQLDNTTNLSIRNIPEIPETSLKSMICAMHLPENPSEYMTCKISPSLKPPWNL